MMEGSCDTEWDVDKYKSDHEPLGAPQTVYGNK